MVIELAHLAQKKIAVVGLGKSGMATLKALDASGAAIYAWDDYEAGRQAALALLGDAHHVIEPRQFPWEELEALVLAPGIPLTHPAPHPVVQMAQSAHCPIICDVELLFQAKRDSHFIGITGTNGKSTTTSLIHHILNEAEKECEVGGNLGFAALSLKSLSPQGSYVMEMSSYQLDLLDETHFNSAIWLNITPDHLDRHGGMEGYIKAKRHIFNHQSQHDLAVIGVDDQYSSALYQQLLDANDIGNIVPVSCKTELEHGVAVLDGTIIDGTEGEPQRYDLGEVKYLPGVHNAQNIAAAYVVCRERGVSVEKIISAIRSFKGLKHRIQWVLEKDGVSFINDSKATNAEATEKALLTYQDIYWIVGGQAKDGGIEALAPYFSKVKKAYLIGEAAAEFACTLEGKVVFEQCQTLEKATELAAKDAFEDGTGTVLLSPACASFDQWKNFEIRGDVFCNIVEAL